LEGAPWGFAVDTSCHFLRLMFSGLFDAYPKLARRAAPASRIDDQPLTMKSSAR
jgi:hypothetical protein